MFGRVYLAVPKTRKRLFVVGLNSVECYERLDVVLLPVAAPPLVAVLSDARDYPHVISEPIEVLMAAAGLHSG